MIIQKLSSSFSCVIQEVPTNDDSLQETTTPMFIKKDFHW